jgi:signal transduction histidine kinase
MMNWTAPSKTINDMLDRIDGAVQEMRRFSADASHELQTPLTILKGEIEVALLKQSSPSNIAGSPAKQQRLGAGA